MELMLEVLTIFYVFNSVLASNHCVRKEPYLSNGTKCPPGCYFSHLTQICKVCKLAMPGEIYTKTCSPTENAVTTPCLKNQYTFDNLNCHNCTDCNSMGIQKPCSLSNDTVCKKEKPADVPPSGPSDVEIGVSSAVGFAVLAVIVYVIVRRCKKRNNNNWVVRQRDIQSHEREISFTDICAGEERDAVAPLELASRQKPSGYQRTNSQISQSSITTNGSVEPLTDNATSLSLQSASHNTSTLSLNSASSFRWTKTSMEDLSFGCRDELAKLLAPDSSKNWRHLADKLGFNDTEIRNFEMFKGSECVSKMLYAFNGRKNASIPTLYDALVVIGRHDACKVIRKHQKELK